MKKFVPGEVVEVRSKNGNGTARVCGVDPVSGTIRVQFDSVTVDDGEKRVTHKGVEGYVPGGDIRRG